MKKINPSLIESGFDLWAPYNIRHTVRAIIFNHKKQLLMLYSKVFDDYTFPGGGLKRDEDDLKALRREISEELGADIIKDVIPYGYTEEFKFGIENEHTQYHQISKYYQIEIMVDIAPTFNQREKTQALTQAWVDIDAAILHNQKAAHNKAHQKPGLKTVLLRENLVLNDLKEKS